MRREEESTGTFSVGFLSEAGVLQALDSNEQRLSAFLLLAPKQGILCGVSFNLASRSFLRKYSWEHWLKSRFPRRT